MICLLICELYLVHSSLFNILNVIADLSKCCISYEMQGLSYWQMI